MSVERKFNWLGQMRVDAPFLRSMESSICADFDTGFGSIVAGGNSYVIKGFTLAPYTVGQRADLLILNTTDSILVHPNASESGTFFETSTDQTPETLEATNPNIQGSFTPNSKNYIGVDLIRRTDPTTTNLVQFNNPDTNQETGIRVPLGRTLSYAIIISNSDFSTNLTVCPLHIVTTDSTNKVLSIQDARPLFFRLGSGGSRPNSQAVWGWPGGRSELINSAAGDLSVGSFKSWLDAVMTRLFELGGGEYWYSNTADRNVQAHYTSVFSETGEPYRVSSGNVLWQGVSFIFDNSTGHINEVQNQTTASSGLTNLTADGDCIYVDLDRTQNRTVAGTNPLIAQRGNLNTLGTSSPPGSRYVLVAKVGSYYYTRGQYLPIGSLYRVATTAAVGGVELNATPYTPLAPQVATISDANGTIAGAGISRYGTSTSGPILIGGTVGIDGQVVLIGGDNNTNILVQGHQLYQNGNKLAALQIDQLASEGIYEAHITDFRSADAPGILSSKAYIDAQGSLGLTNVIRLPNNDLKNAALGVGAVCFMRPSKYWQGTAAAAYEMGTSSLAYTISTYNNQKRLTSTTNGALVIDGITVQINYWVLFFTLFGGAIEAGIWLVTQTGSPSTPWILDRPGLGIVTGTSITCGTAIAISAGTIYGGEYFILSTPDPLILDTTPLFWSFTDKYTTDQYCIRWGDGTVSVLSESAQYNTWSS
jgi:hypothetical protein